MVVFKAGSFFKMFTHVERNFLPLFKQGSSFVRKKC